MMTFPVTPLSRLLTSGGNAQDLIAVGRERDGTGDRTREQFTSDVASLASRISDATGRHWLIADRDTYAIAVGLFAVLHAGGTAVLPANLQEGHLQDVADNVEGSLSASGLLANSAHAISIFAPHDEVGQALLEPVDASSAEIVLHTSGTTGAPTSIRKPLRCFEAELASQSRVFNPQPGKTVVATVPAYHIYGLLFRILWPLATNRPFSVDTVSYPEELLSAAEAHPGCMFVSSPAFLKRALPVLNMDRIRSGLGPVFSSGGLLPPPVAAAYNAELTQPVVEVYGSTETGGIAYRSVYDSAAPPPWQPLPDVEVKADPETSVLSLRSPFMPDTDWFRGGDRIEFLPDGRFVLKGRADRIVKVEEERVSLPELEQRLTQDPAVEAARTVLIAEQDNRRQVIGAVIEPSESGWEILVNEGRRAFRERLLDLLRPHLAAVVLPRKWRFVTAIPEDDRGKTSDATLSALFAEDLGRQTAPETLGQNAEPGGIKFHLRLPDDLFYFDGHFDSAPILSGVVQVDWAIGLAREHFDVDGTFHRIEALKFFKVLMAGDEVELSLRYDAAGASLKFEYSAGDTRYSSGRIKFGAPT